MTLSLPDAWVRATTRRTPYPAPPRKRPREAPLANETNRNIIYIGGGVNPVVRIWRTLAIEVTDVGELHDRHVHRRLAEAAQPIIGRYEQRSATFRSGECT